METNQRNVTNSCNNCWRPIYEGEVFYTISLTQKDKSEIDSSIWGGSVGDGYNDNGWNISETWIQCAGCYYQWQEELAKSKVPPRNWWAWGLFIDLITTGLITYYWEAKTLGIFFGWGIVENIVVACGTFASGIFLIWFLKQIFGSRPITVNRFKLRIKEK